MLASKILIATIRVKPTQEIIIMSPYSQKKKKKLKIIMSQPLRFEGSI